MNKKKVCFLTQYYLPEMGAPPARISEIAKALVAQGYDISIVTAVPNRPHGKIQDGFEGKHYYQSNEDQIHIHRVKVFLPKYFGSFGDRLVTEASFCFFATFYAIAVFRRSDFIVIQNPPLFSGLMSLLLKLLTNAKLINWCSDIWPDLLIELGTLRKGSLIARIMKWIQKINFACSDAIAVTTPHSVRSIEKNYQAKNILLWRNGVDTDFFIPKHVIHNYQEKWGFSNSKYIIGYAGLHGNFQNLHILLDACKLLLVKNSTAELVLVGEGNQKAELEQRKSVENISNIRFCEPVVRDAMPDLLQSFDILLIPLAQPMPTTIPSKFYESLAAGKPLIVVSGSEMSCLVEENELGSVYDCGDALSLANCIHSMTCMAKCSLTEMGLRSRKLSLTYDRQLTVNEIDRDLCALSSTFKD